MMRMPMCRETTITKALREYKRELYCSRDKFGKRHIYQKSPMKWEPDRHVCSLTHNWSPNGEPVDWGIEPIKARIKAIDLCADGGHEFWREILKSYERQEESKERDRKNTIESNLYELHSEFKKAFKDVNTGSMAKLDKRRMKDAFSK
jgi:hypothetical protein